MRKLIQNLTAANTDFRTLLLIILTALAGCDNTGEEKLGPPVISSITKTVVAIGEITEVVGENFGTNAAALEIKFNGGAIAQFELFGNRSIQVTIPEGALSGKITITRDALVAESPVEMRIRSWREVAEFPTSSFFTPPLLFFAANGKLYAGISGGPNASILEFNSSSRTWVFETSVPIKVSINSIAYFTVNNKLYIHIELKVFKFVYFFNL